MFVQPASKVRADQERELDDLLRTYQVEEDELTLWVNALCGKYGMKELQEMTCQTHKKVLCDYCDKIAYCICVDYQWYCAQCEHEHDDKRGIFDQ